MNPEKLFERLINNEITREEFEALLEGIEDDQLRARYDAYLESMFMKEIETHFSNEDLQPDSDFEELIPVPEKKATINKTKKYYAVAAAVVILLGVVFSLIISTTKFNNEPVIGTAILENEHPLVIKNTPNKRMFRMRLPDGSFVHLNAVSSISYPKEFDQHQREIEIHGEAYFDIKRDEKRPFNIKVKDYAVQVLGTAFDIEFSC